MARTLRSALGCFFLLEGEVPRDKGLHKFMVPNVLADSDAVEQNVIEKLMTGCLRK